MTLKTRNTTILLFTIISFLIFASMASIIVMTKLNFPFTLNFSKELLSINSFSLFTRSPSSLFVSLIMLQIYILVFYILLLYHFEKTQSPLIILFTIFLAGNQLEIFKLFIALLNLQQTYSKFFLLLANFSMLGKFLSMFSFFLIAANSKETQKLNIEIDIVILITVCVFVTICIPFNTTSITQSFDLKPGFNRIVKFLYIITFILTSITFYVNYYETENKLILKLLYSYLFIIIGLKLVTEINIFFLCLIGFGLLIFGTRYFFKTMHKMYSWD